MALRGLSLKTSNQILKRGCAICTESVNIMEILETNNTTLETEVAAETQEQGTKTYTADEVAKLIQSEADRRTNQALAKQKKEYEKKLSLSSLDEQQRKDAEAQMRIEELQNQLAEFQIERNKSELKSVLASRGLSAEFADLINITDNIEESQTRIDSLDKLFKAAVKAEVEKRLAGSVPKGTGTTSGTITKADIMKMSLAEQQKFKTANPQLYKSIFNN